jgi:nucleotide-binding universal stress UspA family protein
MLFSLELLSSPTPAISSQAVFSSIGIGLALIFAVLMASLFIWMFRVPRQVPLVVAKARQSVSAMHRILVPVTSELASERAVELACRLGEIQKAEIVLVYVIEMPFTLSLNSPVPEEEKRGEAILITARNIVEQHNLPVKIHIIPHRYAWGGILNLSKQYLVDAIVMGVGHDHPGAPQGIGKTMQEVIARAECEVIIDRRPVTGSKRGIVQL